MPTVLLVDDSAIDRRLFGMILQQKGGFHVTYSEDGAAAMEHLEQGLPDLVVTDMQMPRMDGLQLVTAVRSRYPQLPVILLTGKGSEALATRALQQGAAGYVPKSEGQELLLETIRQVLELAQSEANLERVIASTGQLDLRLDLPNDRQLIDSLVALLQRMVTSIGVCDANGRLQVGVALEHALLNAMCHGNLELGPKMAADASGSGSSGDRWQRLVEQRADELPYSQRRISVGVRMTCEEARFVVSDEGPGFKVQEHTEVGLSTAPGQSGQGLFLMWAFMDRVSFNRAGNTVTMVKRRRATAPESAPTPVADEETGTAPIPPEALGELVFADKKQVLPLTKSRLIVGRDASCDVTLDLPDVSLHHCLLYVDRDRWYVRDLGSRSGIKVNNIPVHQHPLEPATVLTIGRHRFVVKYDPHMLPSENLAAGNAPE